MTTAIKDLLTQEEIRNLTARSDAQGWWAIIRTWLLIAATFTLLALYPHPLLFVLAVFVLGGQHLALAILAHEAAHRTLFKTRALNETVADWLCARPIWADVERYRKHHVVHHAHTGTEKDPDMSLVTPFPCRKLSLLRKFARDLSGVSGLRRIVGLVAMDTGILKYTIAADVERIPRNGRPLSSYFWSGVKNMGPMILANTVLAGILAACSVLWVYSVWVLGYLIGFSLFLRIRSMAEHSCLEQGPDVLNNTRTTRAGWLARLTVAPLNVNYHVEHHLMASVPFYNLPKLHALLASRGALTPTQSYAEVLKLASAKP